MAAPSDLAGAVKSGSPSLDGDAVAVGGSARQHSSGEQLSWPLTLRYTHAAAAKSPDVCILHQSCIGAAIWLCPLLLSGL